MDLSAELAAKWRNKHLDILIQIVELGPQNIQNESALQKADSNQCQELARLVARESTALQLIGR
jgi:hypothetical protein